MRYMLDTNICIYAIKNKPKEVIEILSFDVNAAESYGEIRAELERKGTPIGPLDMMIAGHAKSLGLHCCYQ